MLTPREIVAEAWAITTKERQIRKWGFFSAAFETLRNIELLLYQGYYLYWYIKGVTVGWLSVEMLLFKNLPLWFFIVTLILMGIVLLFQIFAPALASGAIIGLAAKSHRKEKVKGGLVLALYNFFPIFELHAMFILSSVPVVFTFCSFAIRYVEGGFVRLGMIGLLIFLSLISLLFHFFASFAEEAVVIKKIGIFDAIGRSFKLIISNITHIVFVFLLLLVISIRIVVNAVVLLLLPAIIIGTSIFLAYIATPLVSVVITSIVALALLFVASYLFAYLLVFKQTVWTLTYMELSKAKDLDVIEEEVSSPAESSEDKKEAGGKEEGKK